MTDILVVGTKILCAGVIVDAGDRLQCDGTDYPKSVIGFYQIVDAGALPDDFTPQAYIWIGSLEANPGYVAPTLSPEQEYTALIAAGVTIVSTSAIPALASPGAVFSIDPESCADIAAEAQFISTYGEFTNGSTSALTYYGCTPPMTVTTTAQFLAVSKPIAQYVAAAKTAAAVAAGGGGWRPPTSPVTIA